LSSEAHNTGFTHDAQDTHNIREVAVFTAVLDAIPSFVPVGRWAEASLTVAD
tara:strand:+ start:34 stop:189 length:156 start_codon:yes stop_codon:yes gene_type:complete